MGFVIGCDIGTQSTKGVLIGEDGEVRAVATARYEVGVPAAGWAEQDPADWIQAVAEVVRSLVAAAPGPVTHIGIDAQVDGVVATDRQLNPLHPALIWMDRRATAHTSRILQRVGADRVFEITGLNCDSSHGAPKMMWLLETLGSRPAYLLPPATVVTSWLTGSVRQDHANASSSMVYDVTARTWSEELLEACRVDPELLPPVVDSTDVVGTLRPQLAAELGLPASVQVVAGTGDDHAAAVAAGVASPGVIADVTGTAEPIGAAATAPVFDSLRLLETHAHAVPATWFIENPGFVSGGSTLWVSQLLGLDQGAVFELAAQASPGSKGLIFIPALSGSMAPRWNDHARGSFTGASLDHGREELCRAVLEGTTFALRDNVDRLAELGLGAEALHVTGGGARSPLWLQMKADVTGRPVKAVEGEGAAVGAACLAAVAAGWFPDVESAATHLIRLGDRIYQPDPAAAEVYQDAYRRYRATFDALEPTYTP